MSSTPPVPGTRRSAWLLSGPGILLFLLPALFGLFVWNKHELFFTFIESASAKSFLPVPSPPLPLFPDFTEPFTTEVEIVPMIVISLSDIPKGLRAP